MSSARVKVSRWALGLVTTLAFGCAPTTTQRLRLPPLQTVTTVDLGRYVGRWYEIASFPQRFQKGCTATTADYEVREDGEIDVVNRCRKGSLEGPESSAVGRARVTDKTTNAKLEVSFFWPFWGDYWIIQLAPDYSYAVVGAPGRDYLWILSRTPKMTDSVYGEIVVRLKAQGYETRSNRPEEVRTPVQLRRVFIAGSASALSMLLVACGRVEQGPECEAFVECVAALDVLRSTRTNVDRFLPDGACWGGAKGGAVCESSCRRGVVLLREQEPELTCNQEGAP